MLVLESRGQAVRLVLLPGFAAAVIVLMLLLSYTTLLLLCHLIMPHASIASLLPNGSSFKPGKILIWLYNLHLNIPCDPILLPLCTVGAEPQQEDAAGDHLDNHPGPLHLDDNLLTPASSPPRP